MQCDIPWQPPPSLFIKINCDGAVLKDGVEVGWGALIRNEFGDGSWSAYCAATVTICY